MKASFGFASILAATAAASPVLESRDIPPVGFGQQIQISSEANYWVVWHHGETACPNTRTLGPLTDSPCGLEFTVPSGTDKVKLCECNGNNEPQSLCTAKGDVIRGCDAKNYKIHCHGDIHDIVQHGHC